MYYKQPKYYSSFQCIGEKCMSNCCYGWEIIWNKNEIDKLLNAENISPELRGLVENSFVQDKNNAEKFLIKLNNDNCPFQTENGLCIIQKELGAEYLSKVCTEYPRTKLFAFDRIYRFCRMTCPVVMERLLNDENCMNLTSISAAAAEKISVSNAPKKIKQYPVQKYRAEIFEFFYELISDKKIDTDSAVILGALAASALTKIQEREDFNSISEQIKSLRKQMHDGNMLKSLDNIKPNPQIKFSFLPIVTETITGSSTTVLLHNSDGSLNEAVYVVGEQRLQEALHGREYFWRNVALSLLFEFDVPFMFEKRRILENYSLFATAYACVKLNLIAALATEKSITMQIHNQEFLYDGDNKIIGLTALICRGLCQNASKSEKIIDMLKENGYDRPAYLALFVK